MNHISTPALLVNFDQLLSNIKSMASLFKGTRIRLFPHIKTHKSTFIAELQIQNGAYGLTCATIEELAELTNSGVENIFLAYPVLCPKNLGQIVELSNKAKIEVAIDCLAHINFLENELKKYPEKKLAVRIEIDSGHHRCGILSNNKAELRSIAQKLGSSQSLVYSGVFTHAGQAYSAKNLAEIRLVAQQEAKAVIEAEKKLRNYGLTNGIISVGTTPTAKFSSKIDGITECRPGNYVFYDAIQVAKGVAEIEECAAFVFTTVISKTQDRIVIDSGSKALGLDKGAHGINAVDSYGLIKEFPDLKISRLSEEHGIIDISTDYSGRLPQIGDRLKIIPNHACAAINYFSHFYLIESSNVIKKLPVNARR